MGLGDRTLYMPQLSQEDAVASPSTTSDDAGEVQVSVILELLGDAYTRQVLQAVADEPRSGTEVAERTRVSKPTAFRRLNRLAEIGLVTVTREVDLENGHHTKQYEATLDRIELDLLASFESPDDEDDS